MGREAFMSEKDDALKLIAAINKAHLRASCGDCGETFDLAKAGLFYGDELTPKAKAIKKRLMEETKGQIAQLKEDARRKAVRVEAASRSVNIGFAVERIAPAMSGFGFERNDCRSLFDPIDYVIFDGLSRGRRIERIIFSDIKSGRARLSESQRQIKEAVEGKKVGFHKYDHEAES
jgi:predicted Holliday junction resolvase-like endonuclease